MCAPIRASARWFWIRAQHWDVKLPWQPNTQRHTTSPWHHDYFATTICTNKTPLPQINVCGFDCRSSVQKKEGPSGFSSSLLLGTFAIWRQQEVGETKQGCKQIFSHLKRCFFFFFFTSKTLIFTIWVKATLLFLSLIYSHLEQTCSRGVSSCQTTHTCRSSMMFRKSLHHSLLTWLIICCYILQNIIYLSSIN